MIHRLLSSATACPVVFTMTAAAVHAGDTKPIVAGRRTWRWTITVLLAVLLSSAAWPGAAEDVYITQDDTSLLAAPADDAEVLLRPNAGHRLIVLERKSDWLKVRSPQHMVVGKDMWVTADKVGPPPLRAQPAPEQPVDAPRHLRPGFHLVVNGTPGLEIRTSCRVVEAEAGLWRLREFTELLPAVYDLEGSAVSCSARKLDDLGRLKVALSGRDGTLIVTAETAAPFGSLSVRSAGPWGDAGASRGLGRILLLKEAPRFSFGRPPAGAPVPPFTSPPVPPLSGFAKPRESPPP